MIGSAFTFDGNTIPTFKDEAITAKWLATNITWNPPITQNSEIDRQDFHGVISNPTLARARLITITGQIVSFTKAGRGAARNEIDLIFQLDTFPTQGEGFKDFSFTDDDGIAKTIQAKVFGKPSYDNEQGDAIVNFTVELVAQDPLIAGQALKTNSGIYGQYGGSVLPMTLPEALDGNINAFTVTNSGNFAAPVKAIITGDIINPKVLNITNARFFRVLTTLNDALELVIDTAGNNGRGSADINGTSILSARDVGSNWVYAEPGVNTFLLLGDDFDLDDQSKATMTIEFFDTWL